MGVPSVHSPSTDPLVPAIEISTTHPSETKRRQICSGPGQYPESFLSFSDGKRCNDAIGRCTQSSQPFSQLIVHDASQSTRHSTECRTMPLENFRLSTAWIATISKAASATASMPFSPRLATTSACPRDGSQNSCVTSSGRSPKLSRLKTSLKSAVACVLRRTPEQPCPDRSGHDLRCRPLRSPLRVSSI